MRVDRRLAGPTSGPCYPRCRSPAARFAGSDGHGPGRVADRVPPAARAAREKIRAHLVLLDPPYDLSSLEEAIGSAGALLDVGIYVLGAAVDLEWTAWALLNVPALILVGRTLYEAAGAIAATKQALGSGTEPRHPVTRRSQDLPGPEPQRLPGEIKATSPSQVNG